jgi:tight adherence protein C
MISFLTTVICLIGFIYFIFAERKTKLKKRIELFVGSEKPKEKNLDEETKQLLKERFGLIKSKKIDLKAKTGEIISKKLSSQKEEKLEKKLLQLGNPWGIPSADFQIFILVFRGGVPVLFAAYAGILKMGISHKLFRAGPDCCERQY